jgi:bifunctional DNA-binding transcriptional regulator/antitoxin component of YhaV-PrlF toxin-antitoxin module
MKLEVEVELRRKNQLTLPDKLARKMRVREGSRLVFEFDEERNEARVRPLRESYAGALRGVYGGTAEDVRRYVDEERRAWTEE